MALKAGYYGVKKNILDELNKLDGILPAGVSKDNKLSTKNDVFASVTLLDDTVGWLGNNKLPNNAVSKTESNATLTVNADKTVTVTISGSVSANTFLNMGFFTLKKGSYVLSQGVATGNDGCRIQLADEGANVVAYIQSGNADHIGFTLNEDKVVEGVIRIPSGWNQETITFKPMICDPDVYSLSPTYRPYHESVEGILDSKMSIGNIITSADDLNNITGTGLYGVTTSPANAPESQSYFTLLVQQTNSGDIRQVVLKGGSSTSIYVRSYGGSPSQWYNWYKFTGTEVTPQTQQASAPETREASDPEPEPETKTTKRSTKKTDTTE